MNDSVARRETAPILAESVLALLPTAVFTTAANGRLSFYNDAAAEFWGRRPAIGEAFWCGSLRLLDPDGSALSPDQYPLARAVTEQRNVDSVPLIIERPDGTRRRAVAYARPLEGGAGGIATLLGSDTHQGFGDVEHRLAAIVESSDDAIISKDLNGIIRSWNHGATQLFGYAAEETIGKSIEMLFPPDRVAEEQTIIGRIKAGERLQHYETVRRRKDGSLRDISLTVSPIVDASGRIVGASKIARDITQRRESEKRILMLMREVNHRVKNQYALILAMIRESGRHARTAAEYEERIVGRVMALSRSQDLLVHADWRGASLGDLVREQVVALAVGARLEVDGPPLLLQPGAAQYLGMALHELAVNSLAFGALGAGGKVAIKWSIDQAPDGRRFRMTWNEATRADRASRPAGYGRLVLERIAPRALEGKGALGVTEEGVSWVLESPLTYLLADGAG